MSCLKCGHEDCGPDVYWIGIVSVGPTPITTTKIPFGTLHKKCAGDLSQFLHRSLNNIVNVPEFADEMIVAVIDGSVLGANQGSDKQIRFFPRAEIPAIDLERDGAYYIPMSSLTMLLVKVTYNYQTAVQASDSAFTHQLNELLAARKLEAA